MALVCIFCILIARFSPDKQLLLKAIINEQVVIIFPQMKVISNYQDRFIINGAQDFDDLVFVKDPNHS
jgi:hypothetical protein